MSASSVYAATFVVRSTGDTSDQLFGDGICADSNGVCTLRAAIQEANTSNFFSDTIVFSIGNGGYQVIRPISPLPVLSQSTNIDGTTQRGYNGNPLIEIDGSLTSGAHGIQHAYVSRGGLASLKGLIINNFDNCQIQTSFPLTITRNYLGTNKNATLAQGGQRGLCLLFHSSPSLITHNIIAGNMTNIWIEDSYHEFYANALGTNFLATIALGGQYGMVIAGGALSFNAINTIGGSLASSGNIIAYHSGDGIWMSSATLPRTLIQSNTIAQNNRNGIVVASRNVHIRANRIFANGLLGIDLGDDGVSVNDYQDADNGANNVQNFPHLASATVATGVLTLVMQFHSAPNMLYNFQFFASSSADPSGYGEGETYLGQRSMMTDAQGNIPLGTVITLLASVQSGQYISALATDPAGNTSEFSRRVRVSGASSHTSFSGDASQ